MELICIEQYNDINFTLVEGDCTDRVTLTDEFKASLLKDYPHKFKLKDTPKTPKQSELSIDTKEDSLSKKITKK